MYGDEQRNDRPWRWSTREEEEGASLQSAYSLPRGQTKLIVFTGQIFFNENRMCILHIVSD